MRHLLAAILLSLLTAVATPAFAGFDESRAWFETLGTDERSAIQADLTLLGFYEFLVDGQFGNGTYQALTGYQSSIGRAQTGVLIDRDKQRLSQEAAQVYSELGMDLVRDKEGQAALIIPVGLLTVMTTTERGNSYTTSDGGISLTTSRRPTGELSFNGLYEEMKTPGNGRFITFSNYNDERFVVTGKNNGFAFYSMFQNAETDSVGYTLTWTSGNDDQAEMLAVFIASHFTALRYMPAEEEDHKFAEAPAVVKTIGVFSLPANAPEVILMNGEVTHTLATDFELALKARPEAKVIVLNSPGGYVNNALQVAHEVRRRGMKTLVASGMGCYSACAYIFFAGSERYVEGELGVHQISAEVADLVLAQTTLGDVLDALATFGVEQTIISVMLKTPPEQMYVFTTTELVDYSINQGEPVRVADISTTTTITNQPPVEAPVNPDVGGAAYVELSMVSTEAEAERSLQYAMERWAGLLGDAVPEIERTDTVRQGTVFHVRIPARSAESANALCAAIKSAGGGCFVTQA